MADPEFVFLLGGTLVSIFLQLFVLIFFFVMVWGFDGVFLVGLFRAIFLGALTGVFISAAFAPAQPFVAAAITTLLVLITFRQLTGHQRAVVVLLNVFFAFGPPVIRAASGL